MIVLICGMPRSASTWSYNVCRLLVEAAGLTLHPESRVYEAHDFPDTGALDIDAGSVLLIKCHHPPAAVLRDAVVGRSGIDRILYTVRDPRVAAGSLKRAFGTSFRSAAREIQRSLLLWQYLIDREAGHVLTYDRATGDPVAAIRGVADYLGLTVEQEAVAGIAAQLDREALRRKVESFDDEELRQLGPSSHDPATLLTKDHFPGDRETDWRGALTKAEAYFATRTWAGWLRRLGLDPTPPATGSVARLEALRLALRCRLGQERLL